MAVTGAKQRLLAIDVGEVSIVDHPANQEDFVVKKAIDTVGLDPFTATHATLCAMRELVYRLGDKLGDPSKIADAQAEFERIKAMLANAQQFSALINKSIGEITVEVTKAKKDDAKDDKDGKKGKGKVPAFMKEEMAKFISTLKDMSDDDSEDDSEESTKTAKALDTIVSVSKKGVKQLSKERLTKLKEAFKHMGSLIKEADPDGYGDMYKDMTKDIDTGKPADPQTGGQAIDNGNPTGEGAVSQPKAATPANGSANKAGEAAGAQAPAWFSGAIDNLKKDLGGQITEVSKRVEAVEKVEAVSKALPHGGADGQPVVKKDNLWKGLI